MIYDPITRQEVEIVGRYPPERTMVRMGQTIEGHFRFVRLRYGELTKKWKYFHGGFPVGEEKDAEIGTLIADGGFLEILEAYEVAPLISA